MVDMVSSNNTFANNSMIFKTIDSSVDNTRKTLALFNKDWNTYKTNWQQGFSQNGVAGGIKSIFQSSNSNSVISKDQLQILRNWNNAVAHGCTNQETFNRIIKDADSNTKLYFSGLNKGKGSVEGLKNAQNVAKQSTIGLTLAQTALNAAISLGFTAALMLAVKGLDKLINSAKRASEAADEAFSDTTEKVQKNEEEAKSLDELISKYKELKESENLDVDGRKEIKEIQNDIADLVGVQASNLDLVNGKLDDEIAKLDEISAKEAKNAYETATANYNNSKKATDKAAGDDSFLFVDGYSYTGKREKEAEKVLKNAGFGGNVQSGGFFGNTLFVMDSFDNDMKELKGAQEKADYLQSMIDVLEQNGQRATDLYAGLISQRDKYLQYIDNQQDAANSLVNSWISYSQFSNDELSKINVDSLDSFEEYRQKMIEEAKNDESIGKMLADGTLSDEDLENAVNDFMATSTKFSTWYEQWIGNIESDVQHETPISSTDILAQVQALSTGLDQLDKIYADVYNKEDFDWSSILNNDGFKEAFGNMTNVTEDYKNAYDDFIKTISNNPADLSACQSAFDNLATAYIYNSDALKNVTEETKASTIAMLNQMGIVNAAEVVNYRLGASESYAADTGKDLESATLSEITAFAKEADMSDITKASLAAYVTEKIHAASITITTSADINNLTALCSQLGVAGTALAQFARLKAIAMDTSGKYTDGYKEYATTAADQILQNAVNAAQTKYTPQFGGGSATKKAVNDAAKAAKDAAKDVKEAVAETFDFIENGINRFDRALSKLEDKAGKTSSSFTSRLNAYKEALNATTFGIELLTDDYNKYMQKANEVGLNEDIASAVRGGASNIWDYSDDTVKQQIKDYQSWYDKAQDCLDKIDELKDKQLELTQASIELLITQYEKLATKIENVNDRTEKWISLKESWGFSANTKNYDSMNKNIQKQIDFIIKQDEQLKLLQKTVAKGSEAWYEYNERIDSNKASLIDLKQQMQENATAAAVLAKATADKKTEKYDSQDELYDAKIDNATSAKSKNKLIDKKISNINKTQKAYNTAVSTDNKNLKSAKKTISKFKSTKENKKILASIKKAAKAGKRISQSLLDKASKLNDNGKLYNACVQYNAYWDAKQSDKATADLYKETAKQDKADLAKEKFDNISSDYDNKISSNEQKKTALNNKISLAQEQGKQVSAAYYKSLISSEKGEKNKLIKERKDLQKSLNDAVIKGSIKKGSDEWYEMVSAINEVTNAIDESTQSIVEFQNTLRQLKWDTFDKSMETVGRINSENDYYIDLMSHKDMTDKDTGNFTKYGTATIGLHKTNYDNYLAQADEYQREYNKIMRQIEKGELSLSDENVVQRLRDLQDAHRDAKKSAEDELESINDLVKQGYEAQTDALSKLIEKYKKLKDNEKD